MKSAPKKHERRPRHSGGIKQLKARLFVVRWDCGIRFDKRGIVRRKQKNERFAGTRAEAQAYLAEKKRAADANIGIDDKRKTVVQHMQEWLYFRQHGPKPAEGNTLTRYRLLLKNQIAPHIGGIRLKDLKPNHLDRLYADLRKNGGVKGGPLSWTSITQCHSILHTALANAVKHRLIASNPAAGVSQKPKIERPEIKTFELDDLLHILDHTMGTLCPFEGCEDTRTPEQRTKDQRFHIPILLAGMCGLRRGEMLDLHWNDIDFDHLHFAVRRALEQSKPNEDVKTRVKSKKTKSSKERPVAFGGEVAEALRRAKRAQADRLGLQAVAGDQRVVTQLDGSMWLPNTFTKDFAELLAAMGISGYYHMLRHTMGTNMLRNGVPAKVVQQQLGHSSAAFTMDRYGHVDAAMQKDAAEKLDGWLRAGKHAAKSRAS